MKTRRLLVKRDPSGAHTFLLPIEIKGSADNAARIGYATASTNYIPDWDAKLAEGFVVATSADFLELMGFHQRAVHQWHFNCREITEAMDRQLEVLGGDDDETQ